MTVRTVPTAGASFYRVDWRLGWYVVEAFCVADVDNDACQRGAVGIKVSAATSLEVELFLRAGHAIELVTCDMLNPKPEEQ